MADRRKLQGEIDRCLKKVTEGVETFEDIWKKVYSATNTNQKEKYESDLKKEIKKLQRLRDQIKTWLSSSEIKDKRQLQDTRKLIETQMERFKVVERETKTKAYSKEGLSGGVQKIDPAQKEKDEMNQWLASCIDSLNIQIDQFECELETMSVPPKKGKNVSVKDATRVEELKSQIEKHRFHVNKLETLMRMLDNGTIEVDKIRTLQDDVNYYIESCLEPDFEENEYIYDEIDLDESCAPLGVGDVKSSTQSNATSEHGSDSPHNELSTPLTPQSVSLAHTPAVISTCSQATSQNNHHSNNKNSSDGSSHSSVGTPNNLTNNSPAPTPVLDSSNKTTSTTTTPTTISSSNSSGAPVQMPPTSVVKPIAVRPVALAKSSPSNSPSPANAIELSKVAYSSIVATPAPPTQVHSQPIALQQQAQVAVQQQQQLQQQQQQQQQLQLQQQLAQQLQQQLQQKPQTSIQLTSTIPNQPLQINGVVSPPPSVEMPPQPQAQPSIANGPPQSTGSPTKSDVLEGSPVAIMTPVESKPTTPMTNGIRGEVESPQKLLQPPQQPQPQQQPQPPSNQTQPSPSQVHLSAEDQNQDANIPPLLGVAPLGKSSMPKECYYQLHHLTWASQHMPHPSDSDRLRNYLMRQPCVTPSYYPLTVPHADPQEIFQRLTTDSLFFIFYYMEGTKAQYLAAKALKKQSWRFHTKFMMWFQRHEEPKTITEDFEMGTYIYFDYERWSQRRKEGFTFEYRFLEDRDLN